MIKKVAVAGVLLALVVAGVLMTQPSEETRIRRDLNRLAGAASVSEPLHAILLAARAQKISGAFASECRFDTPVRGLTSVQSRQDINRLAARYLAEIKASAMEFQNVQVVLTGDESAEAMTRVRAAGLLQSDDPFLEDHDVLLRLQKVDGAWQIAACEVIKTRSQE